jgi:alpha,alpha-trehalase
VSDPARAPASSDVQAPFTPLERYALIGDAGTAALVSDTGSIDWMCLPRFDSDPVFARLLDPSAGHFSVAPVGRFTSSRRYLPGTAVLETTFETPDGRIVVDDLFAARHIRAKHRGLSPFRPLIRRVRGIGGRVRIGIEVAPRDAFGARVPRMATNGALLRADVGGRSLLVRGPAEWSASGGGVARSELEVEAGGTAFVTTSFAGRDVGVMPYTPALAGTVFDETVAFWRDWSGRASGHRPGVAASAVVLKLLTFAPSGGILAAPTTSLPEAPGGDRNWDYRYVWVRDASWTAAALQSLGYDDEAEAYLTWAMNAMRTSRPRIRSLSTLYGSGSVAEREIAHLRGYHDSRPVRRGNAAADQRQLDNWGHVVDIAYVLARRRDGLDRDTSDAVASLVEFVARHWREPDQGMWEVRSAPEHFVHSKVMAWLALDRGVRLAREFGLRGPAGRWARERDAVRSAVLDRGVDPRTGSFVRSFGSSDVDASLLLIATTGFLPPSDARLSATIDAVREGLGQADLVVRYRAPDGLEGNEGAFVACSFWLAQALAMAGRRDEALDVFDRTVARSSDVGLLPEEIDVETGEFLGNYPQALSHIALVNAAVALDRAESPEDPSAG